jgi:hypothetical protein
MLNVQSIDKVVDFPKLKTWKTGLLCAFLKLMSL